jgi:hypothetical protein
MYVLADHILQERRDLPVLVMNLPLPGIGRFQQPASHKIIG